MNFHGLFAAYNFYFCSMTKQKKPFDSAIISSVEISYFTPDLPPPYAYNYLLTAAIDKEGLKVKFRLEYIDREELEEEEILAEGFTLDDDFSFEGNLPVVWKNELLTQLDKTSFLKGNPEQYPIHLKLKTAGETYEGYPSDYNNWEYFLQELVQGIFEAGMKERPLELYFRSIDHKRQQEAITLKASFLSRTAVRSTENSGKTTDSTISFKELKKILKAVYMPDYIQEKAQTKSPEKPGKYINPGDGLWYEFGKSLLNPDPAFDSLGKAESLLRGNG